MSQMRRLLLALPVAVVALGACNSDSSTGPAGPLAVSIDFAAVVGAQAFVCGQTYAGLGSPAADASVTDFMVYVHNVRLVTATGVEEPVTLTPDNKWQADNVALLDFASGGAGTACPNASADTNRTVKGTVPAGNYTGLKFELGLPFDRNHQDQATAVGPYSPTRMFWSWNGGYKAVRLDLASASFPGGWFIHLGSTGCTSPGGVLTPPTACLAANRPSYSFTTFNVMSDRVLADVASLVSGSNLNLNQGGPAGCMSGTTDADCPSIFSSFGLPFNGGSTPTGQTFFRRAVR